MTRPNFGPSPVAEYRNGVLIDGFAPPGASVAIRRMAAEVAAGRTYAEVGAQHNVHPEIVSQMARRYGWAVGASTLGAKLTPEGRSTVLAGYRSGDVPETVDAMRDGPPLLHPGPDKTRERDWPPPMAIHKPADAGREAHEGGRSTRAPSLLPPPGPPGGIRYAHLTDEAIIDAVLEGTTPPTAVLSHRRDILVCRQLLADMIGDLHRLSTLQDHIELLEHIVTTGVESERDVARLREAVRRSLSVHQRAQTLSVLVRTQRELHDGERRALGIIDGEQPPKPEPEGGGSDALDTLEIITIPEQPPLVERVAESKGAAE